MLRLIRPRARHVRVGARQFSKNAKVEALPPRLSPEVFALSAEELRAHKEDQQSKKSMWRRAHDFASAEIRRASVLADVRKEPLLDSRPKSKPSFFKYWETTDALVQVEDAQQMTFRLETEAVDDERTTLMVPHPSKPTLLLFAYNTFGYDMLDEWRESVFPSFGDERAKDERTREPLWTYPDDVALPAEEAEKVVVENEDSLNVVQMSVSQDVWHKYVKGYLRTCLQNVTDPKNASTVASYVGDFRENFSFLHATNRACGYVFLVDSQGRLRFWGTGLPNANEKMWLRNATRELLREERLQ